jgi:ABC-type branched-subunit amino acid transport system substrate-binding protein
MEQPFIDFCACGSAQAAADVAGKEFPGYIIAEMVPTDPAPDSLLATVTQEWSSGMGTRLTSYPAWSYDGVLAVKYAIEAGASSREELLQYLPQIDGEGLTTQLKFDETLRPVGGATLTALEQVGTGVDDLEPIASYTLAPDGTVTANFVEDCASRSTCQTGGG